MTDAPPETDGWPPDTILIRHLVVALERLTNGKWKDAQISLEYARSRLATLTGSYPTETDTE